jgi:hypothetical protein
VCYLNVCRTTLLSDCFPPFPGESSTTFTIDFGVGSGGGVVVGGAFGTTP